MTEQPDLFARKKAPEPILVNFEFPFWAEFVKSRSRNSLIELFLGEDHALIPVVHAPVAYRVRFSADERSWKRRYRTVEIEILFHDGSFWWPFEAAGDGRSTDDRASLSACRRSLRSKSDVLGILPRSQEYPTQRLEDVAIRLVVKTSRDTMLRRALRKIENNLIVREGLVYQRGGAPGYGLCRRSRPEIGVVACSAGYRTDLAERALRHVPGDFQSDDVQEMARRGQIWTPMQRRSVTKVAARLNALESLPLISIVDKNAHVLACTEETFRTDALFTEAVRIARIHPRVHRWFYGGAGARVDENKLTGRQLTHTRLALLSDLHGTLPRADGNYHHSDHDLRRLMYDIQRFDVRRRLRKYSSETPATEFRHDPAPLDEDDDEAISAFAERR